jgi:hypothetical protein
LLLASTAFAQQPETPTLRAVAVSTPLRVDGRLDEALYRDVAPMSNFVQTEPQPGAAATEKTEVWVSFDRDRVYVSVRAWESRPDRMVVNEMRRDGENIAQNENVAFMFDTFLDRRNSVMFSFNPLGGRMDGQNTNEGTYNGDWNPIWDLAVGRFEGGWTAEAAIPFKSLRYGPARDQTWGFNVRRINRWKNEISYLARVADGAGINGIHRVSQAATLTGIEAPAGARTLDVKPYAVSDLSSDLTRRPQVRNDPGGDVGLDVKYTLTRNLTADFTVNTDFAQVEADEQQVNLTRFNLFFAEKREFFLENEGLFQFGGATPTGDTPTIFYSRRIGLDQGGIVPITAGGRVTGRMGSYSLGLINIQTGGDDLRAVPAANFTVARLRRDVLRKSAIGAIYTRRSEMLDSRGANEVYGVDARFAFFDNLQFNTHYAESRTPGLAGDNSTYRVQMNYDADRYGIAMNHLVVGRNFVPDVGFVRRGNLAKDYVQANFSPRPKRIPHVRKLTYQAYLTYTENGLGQLETRERRANFETEFKNSDRLQVYYTDQLESLYSPFRIAPAVTIPNGSYDLGAFRAAWTFGQQRLASGTWAFEAGRFYGGSRRTFSYSSARVKLTPQIAVEPSLSFNRVDTPFGDFTTNLASSRATYTITPLMFVSGLVQYNSASNSLSSNLRLRWEYRPGSELFVVYNEGRDTLQRGVPELQQRSIVLKVNRLLRF